MLLSTVKGVLNSLWFKLTMAFTFIAMVSVIGLSILFFVIGDIVNFHQFVNPDAIANIINSEHLLFSQALEEPSDERWKDELDKRLKDQILEMSKDMGFSPFSIRIGSNPEMYYRVSDVVANTVFQYPESLPKIRNSVSPELDSLKTFSIQDSTFPDHPEAIHVQEAISDSSGNPLGRVELMLIASHNPWMVARKFFLAYFEDWPVSLASFVFIGLLCGSVANRFVTGRLAKMHAITAIWSAGNLEPRIPLKRAGNDILTKHSQILNGLADEMNSLVALRQQAAILEERNRVARDLHDTVKQKIFALKLQLSSLNKLDCSADMGNYVDESLSIIREAQQDIVNILSQLSPMPANQKRFSARLSTLGDQMKRRYGITTIWERKEDVAFDFNEENTLFSLTQEALNNAARHGNATKFFISVFCENEIKHWIMGDNGVGMTPAQDSNRNKGEGLGLSFMRERFTRELSGGSITVDNGLNGGVKVEIRWMAK